LSAFNGEIILGNLPTKNVRLETAKKHLEIRSCKLRVFSIGERTFIETEDFADILNLVKVGERSDYYDSFRQGATIVPRQFWFVEVVTSPKVGINPRMPTVKTSQRAIELAKKGYVGVSLRGQIESEFLFQAATGSELIPFGHLNYPLVLLPIEASSETAGRYRIVDREEARSRGFSALGRWLSQVEGVWKAKRREKASRQTVYQWLDYERKLSQQNSRTKFKVLYNTSGTYLVSCVAKNERRKITVNAATIECNGLISDHKTYYWDTGNEEEAHYVAGFLNARIIDRLIKPMQSRGDFGERDIHKKVLELPIPKYNPDNEKHRQLGQLARSCTLKVKSLLPTLVEKYDSIGKIRQVVKQELEGELSEIDDLAKSIMLSSRKIQKLDKLLRQDL